MNNSQSGPPEYAVLDAFGELLTTKVRDEAIDDWERILDGRMKGRTADALRPLISRFDEEELALVQRIMRCVVDTTLYQLLWTLQETDWVDVAVRTDVGASPSIRHLSDGLHGEIFTEDGWFARFSKKPYEEF